MSLESVAPVSDDPFVGLPARARLIDPVLPEIAVITTELHHAMGHDQLL
ncbi:MAG TPA: hypothetical protein VIJ42_10900 [Stellaceae bacterium]